MFAIDTSSPSTTSARTPYAAPRTPSASPVKSKRYDGLLNSPTGSMIRSSSPTRAGGKRKALPLSYRRRMSPRAWRTLRRLVLCFASFLLVCTTTGWGSGDNIFPHRLGLPWTREENPGPCQFVSPMEAYRNDLARLQRIHASRGAHGQAQRPLLHDFNESHAHSHAHQHHTFSTNGHLLVSPDSDAPHPIPLLLSVGEKKWEDLLSRQSTTLEEAVEEYTRRYGRRPPKGFDIWWDFAEVFNLVLPDEYDRINLDLAPFFALPKEEMKRRMLMVEDMPETFTVIIKDGRVDVQILDPGGLRWEGTWPRARDAASLIEGFARFLPDLRVTFSIFDQPQIYLSWARRKSLMELGLRNEHTSHLHEIDDIEIKLSRSCSPDSNLRQSGQNLSSGKSFIHDNLQAADICQNPYLVPLHGLTIEHHAATSHPRPHTHLLPLFSLAKTSINSDILITPLDQFFDKPGHDPKWERKKSSKLAWRGSPTGISTMTSDLPWRDSHRVRLHHHANNKSSAPAEVMVPHLGSNPYDGLELGQTQEVLSVKKMNDFFFDMKLAGRPLQCMEDDGTCADMQEEIDFAPFQSSDDLNKHKFLLDIDGNGWSGRFRRLMRTNSLVIKTSLFTEWFQPHLIPWFMYVPAKLDFSDLPDILAFFRGSPKHPDMGFDETAKAIAKNGQCFAQRMFRLEDLQAYMLRLLLEYARLAADDGVDMDFYLDSPSPELDPDYQGRILTMYPDDSPYADDMKESISTGAGHEVDQAEMVSDFDFDHTAGEDGQWAGYEMSEDENHESWRETIPVFSDEEAEHGAHRTDHGVSVHGAHEAALRGVDESDKMRPEVKTKSANRRPKDNTPFMISASSLEDEDESLDSGELEVDEPDQDPFLGGEDDERYWEQVDVADETTADEQENWKN